MKNFDQDLQLIEQYLENGLAEDARQEFEKRLKAEPDLNQAFQKTRAIIQLVEKEAEKETLSMLQQLMAEDKAEETAMEVEQPVETKVIGINDKRSRMGRRRWLAVAASVAVLLVAGLWIFNPFTSSEEDLFAQYYATPTFDASRGQVSDADLQAIGNTFNAQNYPETIQLIGNLSDPSTSLQIFLALSYLETGQTNEAIQLFTQLASQEEQLDEILWYKALAELKSAKPDQAKTTLERLNDGNIEITPKRKAQIEDLLKQL